MAKKRRSKRIFPTITEESIRTLNNLIPLRITETFTARSDKLCIALLQKVLGPEWIKKHIEESTNGFLRYDSSTPLRRETQRMRRIILAEMIYNLKDVPGFKSCLIELAGGQIESTYAALEIGRMLFTMATDPGLTFRFVTPCRVKKRSYDLSIRLSDGTRICAETKCKIEETKITLNTIEESLSIAKRQLPESAPGIVFIKVPRHWLDDEQFVERMRSLAHRFLARSRSIVSVKFYTAQIVRNEDNTIVLGAEIVGEIIAFDERTNQAHRFRKFDTTNWHLFPERPGPVPAPTTDYNGMPPRWKRLFVGAVAGANGRLRPIRMIANGQIR